MGKFPLSAYSGALSFRNPPLSGSRSFFTPLEIVLLTWVDNSFFVFPRLFTLCLCATGLASFKSKAVYLHRVNIWGKSLLLLIWKSSSQPDNWQHSDRDKQRSVHIHWPQFLADRHAATLITYKHTRAEINLAPALFKCVSARTTKLHQWRYKSCNSPFYTCISMTVEQLPPQ